MSRQKKWDLDRVYGRLNGGLSVLYLVHGELAAEISGDDITVDALYSAIETIQDAITHFWDAAKDGKGVQS